MKRFHPVWFAVVLLILPAIASFLKSGADSDDIFMIMGIISIAVAIYAHFNKSFTASDRPLWASKYVFKGNELKQLCYMLIIVGLIDFALYYFHFMSLISRFI
ncbi:MAG: hypothetical protein JWO73_938 [Candidatus Taylorbacteria bacterium]|nr:hypothetical protein [Candidatus Taylorbacteria bacterium]